MKVIKSTQVAILALFFAGCNCNELKLETSSANDLFPKYSFLAIPVSDLPIGAQWVNNDIGASGEGLEGSKITKQKSYSNAIISSDKSTKIKLDAVMLSGFGLGLDAGSSNSTQIVYNNVEVVSVTNVATMNIAANKKYIFKGIRVRDFTIYGNGETLATIDSKFSTTSGTYVAEVTPFKGGRKVSLGGDGLYVAYQLVSFKSLGKEEFSTTFLKAQIDSNKYKIADRYEIEIDTDDVWSCIVKAEEKREKPWNYDDWDWKNDVKDGERIAYLIHENCVGVHYRFLVRDKNYFSPAASTDTKFDVPFNIPWGADTKEDPVVGVYIEDDKLISDHIRIRSLRYENHEKINKGTGTYSSGASLQGKVSILRSKLSMTIE